MLWSLPHTLSNLISSSPESAPWITTVIAVCVGRGGDFGREQRGHEPWVVHPCLAEIPVCKGTAASLSVYSLGSKAPGRLLAEALIYIQDDLWEVSTWVGFCFLSKACVCSPAWKVNRRLSSPNRVCQEGLLMYLCMLPGYLKKLALVLPSVGLTHPVSFCVSI